MNNNAWAHARIIPLSGLFMLLLMAACSPPEVDVDAGQGYFPLEQYLKQHIEHFREHPPESIRKTITMDGDDESNPQTPSDLEAIMNQVSRNDLNKPAYAGIYQTETRKANSLGLHIQQYTLTEADASPVKSMAIFYEPGTESRDSVRGIHIFRETATQLYHSYQISTVYLNDQGHIKNITIDNYQRILRFEPTQFLIATQIM